MTPGNFDWFMHSMLFYHTKHVVRRQELKGKGLEMDDSSSDEDGEDNM